MSTSITNLVAYPALRGYTMGTKWGTVPAFYSIASVTDATCPVGGSTVAEITTTTAGYAIGNAMCLISSLPVTVRSPINPALPVSGSVWIKRVNAEAHSTYRLLMLVRRAGAVNGTTTTLITPITPPIGVWTQIVAENKPVTDPLTVDAYLGVYPATTPGLGVVGGILRVNAAVLAQRPALAPGQRFFDGDTNLGHTDTALAWTGTPGASPSTWTSVRDQIGKFSRWDGAAEVPLTKSGRWDGSAEVPETYVESQVV